MLGMLERGLSRGRTRAFLRWLLCGGHVEPHPAPVRLYESPAADRDDIGVCCSGGGIRSASFNLGALQALQQHGVLQRSKYLTAVSGGAYIASAFCMVAKTWRPEPKAEHGDDSDPGLVKESAMPFHPGSPEEQYLRNHLGYLAPDGLARLHLALRMLAGLLVNVLLIGSPVLVLGLLVGWLGRAEYRGLTIDMSTCGEAGQPACHYAASIPHGVVYAVAGLALAALALAVV